jgi:hypothetical protein
MTIITHSEADLSDIPELPHGWGEKQARDLRELWQYLSAGERKEWRARLDKLRQLSPKGETARAEHESAKEELARLNQRRKNQDAIQLLDAWLADDSTDAEQAETWAYLEKALEEDRLCLE